MAERPKPKFAITLSEGGEGDGVSETRVGVAVGSGIVPLHPASRGRANRKPNISGSDLLSLILFSSFFIRFQVLL
jgi:hypothetical protein